MPQPLNRPMRLLALAALLLAVPFAGCPSDVLPVKVLGFRPLEASAEGCKATSGDFIPRGSLDSTVGTGFTATVTIENTLASNANSEGRLDSNEAVIDTVATTYRLVEGNLGVPAASSFPVAVVIDAQGLVHAPLPLLTTKAGVGLAGKTGTLLVTLTLSGHYTDGDTFTTPAIDFPIVVCAGCRGTASCDPDTEDIVDVCGPDAVGQFDSFFCRTRPTAGP